MKRRDHIEAWKSVGLHALAASQANIISKLIVADSRLQSRIYETLDEEQRKKLDHLRQGDGVAVLNEQ